jgi:tRNA (guanine37-N1)-methyltransferase
MIEGLVDHPHYTRPREFRGMEVPGVLLSGDHEAIAAWRRAERIRLTELRNRDQAACPDESSPPATA